MSLKMTSATLAAAAAAAAIAAPSASAAQVGQLCRTDSVTGTGFSIGVSTFVPDGSLVRIVAYLPNNQYTVRYSGVEGATSRYNIVQNTCYWQ